VNDGHKLLLIVVTLMDKINVSIINKDRLLETSV